MTKPVLNVAFHGFWLEDDVIFEHYLKNSHRFLWKKYDVRMVEDQYQADVIFCSVFSDQKPIKTDKPKIMLVHENIRPKKSWFDVFDYVISFSFDIDHPRHFRIPYWIYRCYEQNITLSDLQKRNIKKTSKNKEKFYSSRRFCNFVYSNPVPFRRKFAHKLSKYKQVDFSGRVDTNISEAEKLEVMPVLRGFEGSIQKTKWLSKYRFSIAFENSSAEGYTTEKIIDAFLANSIPLYWGNPRINEEGFNPAAFLNYFDASGNEDFIQRIKNVEESEQLYLEILSQPVFSKPSPYLDEDYMLKFYDDMFNKRIGQHVKKSWLRSLLPLRMK